MNGFRVLVDTNILLSAVIFRGEAERVIQNIMENHRLLIPSYCIMEASRVLEQRFPGKMAEWDKTLSRLSFELIYTPERPEELSLPLVRDPKDKPIIASAVVAQPDVIVTGDKDFKTKQIQEYFAVYTPSEFLEYFP